MARSGDKIEDLRATIEEFGKVGKNLLKARKLIAPCSIVVTSQEKLDEVVAAIDSKRVHLAKLQDRFHYRIDLAPSDIREVATKRVLAKKDAAIPAMTKLYGDHQGQLNAALRLERTTRRTETSEAEFVNFYPYLPHYIDLCIGIMSGIRLQPGAPATTAAATGRSSSKPTRCSCPTARQWRRSPSAPWSRSTRCTNSSRATSPVRSDPTSTTSASGSRTIPRPRNGRAGCQGRLPPGVPPGSAPHRGEHRRFPRRSSGDARPRGAGEGSGQEARRRPVLPGDRGRLEADDAPGEELGEGADRAPYPKPRERNEITRNVLPKSSANRRCRLTGTRNCATSASAWRLRAWRIEDGDAAAAELCIADEPDELTRKLGEVRDESRQKSHDNDLYWVFALTPEIDNLVAKTFASRRMVEKYDQMRANGKITTDEAACLQDEKTAVLNHESRLCDKLTEAMERGTGIFRGVSRDADKLGKTLSEMLKKLFSHAIPDLYAKLEMGSRPLKGSEADDFLKAADLKALPPLFYGGEQGLGLVIKDGAKFVPNPAADIAKEVLDYLVVEYEYGNKEPRTGKALERRFGGIGYGWDRDMLRLVLAVLFRAGSIETPTAGRSLTTTRNHQPDAAGEQHGVQGDPVHARQTPRSGHLEAGRRKLRRTDRRHRGHGQSGHRRRSQEVRRRGDQGGAPDPGAGQSLRHPHPGHSGRLPRLARRHRNRAPRMIA